MSFKHTINIEGEVMDLSSPKVMGILNTTPDSFYAGSRKQTLNSVLDTAEKMLVEGATFLDIGGYSSRPGAIDISVKEEIERIAIPIEQIKKEFPKAIISIDTFRSSVARAALDHGASMVNDISAGHLDSEMLSFVATQNVPYIAMHMKGTPQNMKDLTEYQDLIPECMSYFSNVLHECSKLGIKDVILDPGFGFAKTAEQSFRMLNQLDHFKKLERPLLVGISRKSMIYRTLNISADEALNGTTVLNTLALSKGASILRVHDVKEAIEVTKLINALN